MASRVIDGKAVAARVRAEVARDVERFVADGGPAPALATVVVGDDPASAMYVGSKHKAASEVGIETFDHRLPAISTHDAVAALLAELNADSAVSGILLQLPVPPPLDGPALTALIDPGKDVDGLTPVSAGLLAQGNPGLVPCTPAGIMELLRDTGVELRGARAVVIGRSILVGKPIAALLLMADATVTVCHSRTQDLAAVCAQADVLVAAVGSPRLVTATFVKPGATVIDVGTNRTEYGLVGDVDFDAVSEVAGAITPVPGGVGPMTIAFLLRNTLSAAEAVRHDLRLAR
jgi:methylenetetrahydrofolate dehydrogenase (NADP+) / methenyltetrahydrofolate cyclohydrolase